MADVTVKRTEDFEPTFGGAMLKARSGLGVTSFGIQLLRLPPERRPLPRARPLHERPGGGLHRARGRGDPERGGRGAPARAGRVRARRPERDAQARHRRVGGARSSCSAVARGGVRGHAVHRGGRARPVRRLAVADDGRRHRQAARRTSRRSSAAASAASAPGSASARSGSRSWTCPRTSPTTPTTTRSHDHQEEVYTLLSGRATLRVGGEGGEEHELEPGVWIRVGPAERRKIITGAEPARVLAIGGSPGQAYEAPEFTDEGGAAPPMEKHEH